MKILSIYFSAELTEEMLQKESDLSLTQGEIKLIPEGTFECRTKKLFSLL